jgi:hypothetical protein
MIVLYIMIVSCFERHVNSFEVINNKHIQIFKLCHIFQEFISFAEV